MARPKARAVVTPQLGRMVRLSRMRLTRSSALPGTVSERWGAARVYPLQQAGRQAGRQAGGQAGR